MVAGMFSLVGAEDNYELQNIPHYVIVQKTTLPDGAVGWRKPGGAEVLKAGNGETYLGTVAHVVYEGGKIKEGLFLVYGDDAYSLWLTMNNLVKGDENLVSMIPINPENVFIPEEYVKGLSGEELEYPRIQWDLAIFKVAKSFPITFEMVETSRTFSGSDFFWVNYRGEPYYVPQKTEAFFYDVTGRNNFRMADAERTRISGWYNLFLELSIDLKLPSGSSGMSAIIWEGSRPLLIGFNMGGVRKAVGESYAIVTKISDPQIQEWIKGVLEGKVVPGVSGLPEEPPKAPPQFNSGDAVRALKVLTSISPDFSEGFPDLDKDGKFGLPDVIFILRALAAEST